MKPEDYPALYSSASKASADAQKNYFNFLRWEYGVLIGIATFGLIKTAEQSYYIIYAILFFIPIAILSARVMKKPEQTCLLYTSPSPRDGLLSRMPSSA